MDLLDQREEGVSWGIIKNTAIEKYLANSDQEKYQELLKYAKLHENAENEDIYRTVREEDHVFVDWRSELYSQLKARDTYPGKFYVQKTRTISNFSSQGY